MINNLSPIGLGGRKFFAQNYSVNVLATSTGTVVATINVPTKCRFRLVDLGNYVSAVAAWSKVTWHFNCNGVPQAPYDAFLDQIGFAAQRQPTEHLEFGGGSIITITADNSDGSAYGVGISLAWELIYQE
jgi:hypothetical protein